MWTRIVKLADSHNDESADWQQHTAVAHWDEPPLLPPSMLPLAGNDVFDNTSEHYHCTLLNECGRCPDHHMVWKVLRWTKIVAFKVARSYYAFPIVLIVAPMLIGILIGFALGSRSRSSSIRRSGGKRRKSNNGMRPSASFWALIPRTLSPLSTMLSIILSAIPIPKKMSRCSSTDTSTATTESSSLVARENQARQDLRSSHETERESGIPVDKIPKHVAVIMDGNRRYGRETYGDENRGHWDGSRKLLDLTKWCQAEGIPILTVYAFSTENWKRDPIEVAGLMSIFVRYCEELRQEALQRNLRVSVLSTDTAPIPDHVRMGLQRLQEDTRHCTGGLHVNVCLSYGSRGEIVRACREMVTACVQGKRRIQDITEDSFGEYLLTRDLPDPDILIRTSGEVRISNFLLWQVAYAELFFLDKKWPEMEKQDLLRILRTYAKGRQRRFGK